MYRKNWVCCATVFYSVEHVFELFSGKHMFNLFSYFISEGLDRAAWITTNPHDGQLFNGDMIIPGIISTVDGTSSSSEQESVQDHLWGIQNLYTVRTDNTELPTLTKPKDDVLQGLVNQSGGGVLGVPWTENPTGAVMSISPQATYMSKIIPNAVLPPSVDVVELSRSRSRSSVRTVSKSSLVSASPASTRASSRVSSRCSTTCSNYSGWTHSGSSETLVSDSSTISSSSTPRVASRGSQVENTNRPAKLNNHSSHVKTTHVNGGSTEEEDSGKTGSAAAFTRNLSVIKRGKKPPAPPSRSYSLHNRKQIWKTSESPTYLADVSTPDVSPYPVVMKAITHKLSPKIPPSNGPTTVPSKESQPVNTDKKTMLAELKIHRNNLQVSSIGAPQSYANGTDKLAELKNSLLSAKNLIKGNNSSPAVMALLSLFEIPTHPKVLAPPAPPPETWAHNQRTFELLCGPGPVNYARWAKKRGLKIADEPDVALANTDRVNAAPLLQTVEIKSKVVFVAPSPSPPPEHCPPIPYNSQAKPPPPPPDFVPSTPTLAAKAIKDLTSWIPPPPLFPPPAPPVGTTTATPVAVQNDTDLPPPPPPFSPQSLLTMPRLLPDIPPPPLQEVPPPSRPPTEPQKIASRPQESQPKTHNVLVTSSETSQQINVPPPPPVPTDLRSQVTVPPPPPLPTDVRSQVTVPSPPPLPTDVRSQVTVSPPPPLPSNVKMEDRLETTETEKRTSSPSPAKEETSGPVVTQSLLQMVRLRSVKSSQSPAVVPDKQSQPKPKSGVNQEAPPKPIRRSLILTSLPPDVEALSNTEPKTEAPSLNSTTTTVSNTRQGSSEPETQSNNIAEKTENTILEPKCSSATCPPTEPSNNPVPAEPATKQPCTETEPKPQTLKKQIQPTVPDPETLPSTTEPKDLSISEPKTQHQAQEPNKTLHNSEKQLSTIEIHSKPDGEQPKTQTPMPIVSSTPPIVSSPANPSMRLQEAIRLKAAAMSSKDNQAKRFGLCSPPPATANGTTVPNSPASMASFIFSKSPKKVVIETPSSLEVQTDLRKTLVVELASVSDSAKPNDSHKMVNKVPPPIAKKPNAKVESVAQNSAEDKPVAKTEHVQTETVQTAGQDVQTENSEKTNE